jgi:hypothetical protein
MHWNKSQSQRAESSELTIQKKKKKRKKEIDTKYLQAKRSMFETTCAPEQKEQRKAGNES